MAYYSVLNPSLCVARLLDFMVGYEDNVRVLHNLILLKDYCVNINKSCSIIQTGSRGEGYILKYADYDTMDVKHDVIVLDSRPRDIKQFTDKTVLLMRRDSCSPGYVILQVLGHSYPRYKNAYVQWNKCAALSSVLLRDLFKIPLIACDPHGPCNTGKLHGKNIDIAVSFKLKQWPMEALSIFKRTEHRQNGWPSRQLLNAIRRKGCHLVAVGDKTSDLVNIQWRISFAVAERALVHSFNQTQLRVYILMKIFHQQVIEKYDKVKELLCSYFMKTTMFYMIEETDPLIWREENLIMLFWRCFMKIVQWVEDGYCPNYFIPENNLMKNKIFGQNQVNLVKVLHAIKQEGWESIYRCNDLKLLKVDLFNVKMLRLATNMKYLEARNDMTYFSIGTGFDKFTFIDSHFLSDLALRKVIQLSRSSLKRSDKQMYTIIIRLLHGFIGQQLFHDATIRKQLNSHSKNKDVNKFTKICKQFLLEGAKLDIGRGPLNLALFYYAMKRYDEVIKICNEVLSNIKPYTVHRNRRQEVIYPKVIEKYKEHFFGQGMSIAEKMKKGVALDVVVYSSCKLFYPKELQQTYGDWYPPVPFAIFLKFLCYHEQGDIDSSLAAIHDLTYLIRDEEQGTSKYPLVYNLLAICMDKVGNTTEAVESCLRSQQLQPGYNDADKILSEILSRE